MNTKEYRIFLVALIICAVIVVGYSLTNHETTVTTPSVANAPSDSIVIPMSIVSIREDATSSPQVDIQYPQFSSLPADFNADISSSTLSRYAEFKGDMADSITARLATGDTSAEIATSSYSFLTSWQPAQINDEYVSIILRYDSYSGGANENQDLETFNYDVASNTPVTLETLFPTTPNVLQKISTLVRQNLKSSLAAASPGYNPDAMLNDGTAPTDENFSHFTFTDDIIAFYFPKYAVAPGAFGEQKVIIPRSSIK